MTDMPIVFSPSWMPPHLLVRDKQLSEITKHVANGRSVYVCGDKATGKTITCKYYQATTNPTLLYVKCLQGLQASVKNALLSDDIDVPKDGVTLMHTVLDNYSILILDDVHEIKDKLSLYLVKDMYDILKRGQEFTLILTSHVPLEQWKKQGRPIPEIHSRYDFAYVAFAPYDSKELYQILKQRATQVFRNVNEEALQYAAAKAARWRDMRLALNILKYAYRIDQHNFTLSSVEEAWTHEKKQYWIDELTKLSHEGIILWIICKLVSDGQLKIYTRDIRQQYEALSKKLDIETLYPAALSRSLAKLEQPLGYIERRILSLGSGGLQAEVKLLFDDAPIIVEAGTEVPWADVLT